MAYSGIAVPAPCIRRKNYDLFLLEGAAVVGVTGMRLMMVDKSYFRCLNAQMFAHGLPPEFLANCVFNFCSALSQVIVELAPFAPVLLQIYFFTEHIKVG